MTVQGPVKKQQPDGMSHRGEDSRPAEGWGRTEGRVDGRNVPVDGRVSAIVLMSGWVRREGGGGVNCCSAAFFSAVEFPIIIRTAQKWGIKRC